MAATSTTSTIRRPLALAWGLLALGTLAVPLQRSGATFTSQSINPAGGISAAADWTPPTVALADPVAVRNGAVLTAQATDAETGIASVTIAWAPTGTTTFATICTDTTAPYTCTLATAGLPADIDLRAVATDNAGYTSTSLVEGVTVDNVAPTGAVSLANNQLLAGTVTVGATASDTLSGVATVTIQRALAGTTTWTTLCTDLEAPWSCRFDTTTVADASYDFRAVITDLAGNTATSAVVRVRVDNTQSSVSMEQPAPYLRGTVDLAANAFSNAGIASVRIEYARATNGTWTPICTDTSAPYGCAFDTTKVADGDIWFRAVLLDGSTKTTTSTLVTAKIDNTGIRGFDVQATNGGALGRLDAGDVLALTYSRRLQLGSILPGWTGAPVNVVVRVRDGGLVGLGGSDDTLDVLTSTNPQASVRLGTVNLRADHIKAGRTATMTATMTQSEVVVNGQPATEIRLTLTSAPKNSDQRTVQVASTMLWSPSSLALDTTGVATSPAAVTELGALDRDL